MNFKIGKEKYNKSSIQAMLMLAPVMIGFIIFTYVPIVYIIRYALYDYSGYGEPVWLGIENFTRAFRDKAFWESIGTTIILTFGKLLLQIPFAMLLALFLNKGLKCTGLFRVMFFLPAIISTAITGLIFSLMFQNFKGIINGMLMHSGIIADPINWMGNKWTALLVIGLASIWNSYGITMTFFLMALQSVPKELYECAELDGASSATKFFRITLPMIGSTVRVVIMLAIVGSMKMNDLILASTNGAPAGQTEVVMTYVFKYFFGYSARVQEVGYASAMSVITGIILAVFAVAYMKFSHRFEVDI